MPEPSSRQAEEVLANFLRRVQEGSQSTFEDLVEQYPAIADELRGLHEGWLSMSGLFQALADMPLHGAEKPSSDDDSSSRRLLARLKSKSSLEARYKDATEIARGGMGAVHKAWDEELRREVALKVALGDARVRTASELQVARFLEEAQVTGQLEHPGIVPVHELGLSADGRAYFAMRLIQGRTLYEIIALVSKPPPGPTPAAAGEDARPDRVAEETWSSTRVLGVILRVCEAMSYAHSKGVIHRDLKPGNVMVGRFGEVYVMDWGLSRMLGREDKRDIRLQVPETATRSLKTVRRDEIDSDSPLVTMDGDVVGTPCYMAPEQAQGNVESVDRRSDVYSVGAMLYHLMTGQKPYVPAGTRASAYTVLVAVLGGPPVPVLKLAPSAHPELAAICEKAMAREASDRYPDMLAMAEDLRAYLEGHVVHAYETGTWAEARKWLQRNKLLAASLAAVVVLLVAGLLTAVSLRRDALASFELAEERRLEAEASALSAQDAERAAAERAHDVLQLSALQDVEDLLAKAGELWPAHPELVPRYEAWIDRARALVTDRPRHVERRASLRERALPRTADERRADRQTHPEYERWQELVASLNQQMEALDMARSDEEARLLQEELMQMESESRALDLHLDERRDWRFAAEHREARWWEKQLTKLIDGLHELETDLLARDAASTAHGWSVPKRLAFASNVREHTLSAAGAATAWEEAVRSIADEGDCPMYRGLELSPQLGLVPLGRDRESGLWEFGDVQTGTPPERGTNGRLVMTEESGLVFVLLPGGSFPMGTQDLDPTQPNYDAGAEGDESPVHEVVLSPFFLSKYEMTQGQWKRVVGSNPSAYGPDAQWAMHWVAGGASGSLLHPVEQVDWFASMEVLARLGHELPSEAQWEYAARGGTATPWWTGDERESLAGAANLADTYARDHGAPSWSGIQEWLNDGYTLHAPVDALQPNDFGLHHVHGNLWEWCRDGFDSSFYHDSPRTDPVAAHADAPTRSSRGGSFNDSAAGSRVAIRDNRTPSNADYALGLRPARGIRSN